MPADPAGGPALPPVIPAPVCPSTAAVGQSVQPAQTVGRDFPDLTLPAPDMTMEVQADMETTMGPIQVDMELTMEQVPADMELTMAQVPDLRTIQSEPAGEMHLTKMIPTTTMGANMEAGGITQKLLSTDIPA